MLFLCLKHLISTYNRKPFLINIKFIVTRKYNIDNSRTLAHEKHFYISMPLSP